MDYDFLTADTIPNFLRTRPELIGAIDPDLVETVTEVGDGNLNLVFIVTDSAGSSVVLKQALPYVRLVGSDWPLTPLRGAREANALRTHAALLPDLVPKTYFFCDRQFVIGMENLSRFRVWRGALMEGLKNEDVATQLGRYVGEVAFGTSVLAVDAEEHKGLVAGSVNPELCKITEDLVFTEPHVDNGRNSVLLANEVDAAEHANDAPMIDAMGEAKWIFMNRAEALIHGDLHTGSVMVRALSGVEGPSEIRVFDPEFAFYGPIAFDLGALWANYTLSAARWIALGDDEMAQWSMNLVDETWQSFERTFRTRYPERIDARVWTDDLMEHLLEQWRAETWLFAGAKMSRRIVGLAKAADIENLDPAHREGAARGVLRFARTAVQERKASTEPRRYMEIALSILQETKTS